MARWDRVFFIDYIDLWIELRDAVIFSTTQKQIKVKLGSFHFCYLPYSRCTSVCLSYVFTVLIFSSQVLIEKKGLHLIPLKLVGVFFGNRFLAQFGSVSRQRYIRVYLHIEMVNSYLLMNMGWFVFFSLKLMYRNKN